MGNEQSSENERRIRDANIQAALQRSLEKQRQLYEQRCQEMLKTQAEALRKEQLASTSGRTAAGTSRYGQNNLYPNLQATTTREQQSTMTSISSPSYQRYNVASQNNVLTSNRPIVPSVNEAKRMIPSAPPITSIQTNKVTSVQNASGLGSELNCPGCGNQFGLDIYQCVGGHSSCKDCKIKSGICGVLNCRRTITDMRNRTLEMYMDDLMMATKKMTVKDHKPMVFQKFGPLNRLKCSNHQDGCSLQFTSNDMGNHLKECPFNEMACPLLALFGWCSWRGKFNQLDSHFADCHPEHRHAQVDTEMSIVNTTDDKKIFHLVLMGTFNFLVHLKIDSNAKMMYLAAQLVGTTVSASKWQYEFHIYNKAQPKRKFQYVDVCTSNTISIEDIYFKKQCAAIPIAYINTFLNNNCINYKFFLKKQIRK